MWLAPALLCVSAVQTAVFDSTYPVLSGFKWQRHYLAMTATPIGPAQVVAGHLAWMTIKIAGCGAIYVAVIAVFGGVRSAGVGTALLVIGLACNLLVRPVAARWVMTDVELANERRLAHERSTPAAAGAVASGGTSPAALVLAWLAVGLPIAWGAYRTLQSAVQLFG